MGAAAEPARSGLGGLDLRGCFAGDGFVGSGLRGPADRPLDATLLEELFAPAPGDAVERASDPQPPAGAAAHDRFRAAAAGRRGETDRLGGEGGDHAAATRTLDLSRPGERQSDERERAPGQGHLDGLPSLGAVIDKYRIEEVLGSGGFAVVYRATHLLMRTQVAIKLLHPWVLRRRPHLAEQLCEEARFTSLITHPNVVRVYDVTSGGEFAYIVMEYIDGISLGRAIARQPMRPLNVLKVGMHVCAGLLAGLRQGLIHRDIKPGNILISRAGHAKIVDFGLARRAALGDEADGDGSRSRVGSEVAGTPAYMAPEQATDFNAADFRADIYSLGASLYHTALGVPPFSDQDPLRLVHAHIHRDPVPPDQLIPTFPPALGALLMRMLAKRPEQRPQSYEELSAELRRIYDALKAAGEHSDAARSGRLLNRVRSMFATRRE